MLTIDLLIMLTMINFNCIPLNGFLSKKFYILQTFFLCILCKAENLSTLQQLNYVRHVNRKQTGEPGA